MRLHTMINTSITRACPSFRDTLALATASVQAYYDINIPGAGMTTYEVLEVSNAEFTWVDSDPVPTNPVYGEIDDYWGNGDHAVCR